MEGELYLFLDLIPDFMLMTINNTAAIIKRSGFISLLLAVLFIRAQTGNLPRKNYESVEEMEQAFDAGRSVVFTRFMANDTTGVNIIIEHLVNRVQDSLHLAFFPDEFVLYNYWLGNHETLKRWILKLDTNYIEKALKKKLPGGWWKDFDKMMYVLQERRPMVQQQIDRSGLSAEDKTFLMLNFDQLLSWSFTKYGKTDSLNWWASAFLKDYPSSLYASYVQHHIGVELKTSKHWSFSAENYAGVSAFSGRLSGIFYPSILFGVKFDFRYNRLLLHLNDCLGFGNNSDSIVNGKKTWQKNRGSFMMCPAITGGVNFIDRKKLKVCAFAGISSMYVVPITKWVGDYGFDFTSTPVYGLSAEFFRHVDRRTIDWVSPDDIYLRVTYTFYRCSFDKKYPGYSGYMHAVTIGHVMFQRPTRRIK